MREGVMRQAGWIGASAVLGCVVAVQAMAEPERSDKIRFKDGTTLSAILLQKDGNRAILQVSRDTIATVNGQPLPPPVVEGAKAPDFSATDLSGATHTLSNNLGHVTLLKFWASWCPHCRSDVPYMKRLFAQFSKEKDPKLRIITVSVDQDLNALKQFIEKEQITYPVISAMAHPELPERYETQGIPTYFLIDVKGLIAKTWSGALTEGDVQRKVELERLLADLTK